MPHLANVRKNIHNYHELITVLHLLKHWDYFSKSVLKTSTCSVLHYLVRDCNMNKINYCLNKRPLQLTNSRIKMKRKISLNSFGTKPS